MTRAELRTRGRAEMRTEMRIEVETTVEAKAMEEEVVSIYLVNINK
jgi:hypothetical protein